MTKTLKSGAFVTTTYRKNEDDIFVPDIPNECICFDGSPCKLGKKDKRTRITGPIDYLLVVMHCKTHQVYFTLYPPGFVPHGRQALVPLGPDGSMFYSDRGPPFEDSFFQAALDGSEGEAWVKESEEDSQMPRFETQRRHLTRSCKLFQLNSNSEKAREWTAELLNVPGLLLHQALNAMKKSKGYQVVASALRPLLERLSETRLTFQRLSACGYYAGLWPKNQFWNVKTAKWHVLEFQEFPSQ